MYSELDLLVRKKEHKIVLRNARTQGSRMNYIVYCKVTPAQTREGISIPYSPTVSERASEKIWGARRVIPSRVEDRDR